MSHLDKVPIFIKDVQPEQFNDLIEFDRMYLISGSDIPDHDAPPPFTHDEIQIAKQRGDEIYWIFTAEGEKAGYYWTEQRPFLLFLSGLVIATPFRGKKIGSQIMHFIEKSAKNYGLNRCAFAVSHFNKRAISFYSSHGYKIVREEPNYFGTMRPNLARLIMEKAILF